MQDELPAAVVELRQAADSLLATPVLTDPEDFGTAIGHAVQLRAIVEKVIAAAIQRARDQGASWKEIGDILGISRQGAFQRYGKPIDPRTGEPMNTAPLANAASLAETVIDELSSGRWSAVTDRFDAAMRDGLSAEALAAAWAQVTGQAGALEGHGSPQVTRAADVTVTNTPLNLEAGEFIARIAFRDDQSIAGLFILNAETA